LTIMKSLKLAGDAGAETRVVILEFGEEAFAALTKFANDAGITAASLSAIGAFEKATVGSILKRKSTRKSRSPSSVKS
jgi:predicted DNA-binding protein with PD1-like motif